MLRIIYADLMPGPLVFSLIGVVLIARPEALFGAEPETSKNGASGREVTSTQRMTAVGCVSSISSIGPDVEHGILESRYLVCLARLVHVSCLSS